MYLIKLIKCSQNLSQINIHTTKKALGAKYSFILCAVLSMETCTQRRLGSVKNNSTVGALIVQQVQKYNRAHEEYKRDLSGDQ